LSRAEAAAVETLLDQIVEIADVGREQRPQLREEVRVLLWRHAAETPANRQEHPKRAIAAYKIVQASARRLLKGLRPLPKRPRLRLRADARRLLEQLLSLPEGLRLPLRAGDTETRLVELIGDTETQFVAAFANIEPQLDRLLCNTERELAKLRSGPTPNRLANPASAQLRVGLLEVFAPYAPDEAERDRRVAEVLRLLGVGHPNEKKDRKRFQGRARPRSRDSCTEKSERRS
jgi:hypothetical protein